MFSDRHNNEQVQTIGLNNPTYFNICDNVEKIKNFYSGMLGLKETEYSENTSVEYFKDGKRMIFYQNDKAFAMISGKLKSNSNNPKPFNWSIKADSDLFLKVFKILDNKQPVANEGYLTLEILDPMGNNISVYIEPEKSLKKIKY